MPLDTLSIDRSAGATLTRSMCMKVLSSFCVAACLLSGCISSSSPPPPEKNTTVVVPHDSGTVVVCQDGTKPPCH